MLVPEEIYYDSKNGTHYVECGIEDNDENVFLCFHDVILSLFFSPHLFLCSLFLKFGEKEFHVFSFVSGNVSMCFFSFLYHLKLEITNLKCS